MIIIYSVECKETHGILQLFEVGMTIIFNEY